MEDKKLSEFKTLKIDDLIAPFPAEKRDASRLMVINRKDNTIDERYFNEIIDYFNYGDCLVLNETKVLKRKIFYYHGDGRKDDMLLLKKLDNHGRIWMALLKKPKLSFSYKLNGGINITKIERNNDGSYSVYFDFPVTDDYLSNFGEVPLPSYIVKKRREKGFEDYLDDERYQTVYARKEGSVAAPTAGFHFTDELIERIMKKGVKVVKIVLHIGWGTFKMVREDPDSFKMPSERCIIEKEVAFEINQVKKNGGRIFVVGTSTMRTLEKMSDEEGKVIWGEEDCDIFIKPGYKFKVADCFITNFHVPDSPPLYMTSAFAGRELLFKAYRKAVEKRYRFYSYGDACLII